MATPCWVDGCDRSGEGYPFPCENFQAKSFSFLEVPCQKLPFSLFVCLFSQRDSKDKLKESKKLI